MQRVKTCQILLALHNTIVHSLGWVRGVMTWSQPLAIEDRRKPAVSWPLASFSPDCGPDLRCLKNFVTRHKDINANIDWAPGFNHAVWNSAKQALHKARLWNHILTILLYYWTRHGPFRQAIRLTEMKEAANAYFQFSSPHQCPLFMWLLPQILQSWGKTEWLSQEGVEDRVFALVRDGRDWEVQGQTINMNRWMKLFTVSRAEDPHWHTRLLGGLVYCMEMDMLTGTRFNKLAVGEPADADGEDGRDRMRDTTKEQRHLTKSCKTLLVASVMILHEQSRQRRQRMICAVSLPAERWQSASNAFCRSVFGKSFPASLLM